MNPQRKWQSIEARKAAAARIRRDEALHRSRTTHTDSVSSRNMTKTELVLVLGTVVAAGYVVGRLFGKWRKSAADGVHGLSDLRSADLVGLDVVMNAYVQGAYVLIGAVRSQ